MRRLWVDRIVETPRTFNMQNNPNGTVTLVPSPGAVIQAGTSVNAANLNGMETDIESNAKCYYKKFDTDDNGLDTRVERYRWDGTLIEKAVLSGGTSPNYTIRTVTFYLPDGVTVDGTPKVFNQVYVNEVWKGEDPV
jgi:hypothetical protein